MMGQRRAMVCRLDMLPPPGEALRVVVESERRVAGEVFFKKGHMDFDWRSTASMIAGFGVVQTGAIDLVDAIDRYLFIRA